MVGPRLSERPEHLLAGLLPTRRPALPSDLLGWYNRDRADRKLPPTGWTWEETVVAGTWSALEPKPVEVPVAFVFTNGVCYMVKQGRLLVWTRTGEPVVYLVCERNTQYSPTLPLVTCDDVLGLPESLPDLLRDYRISSRVSATLCSGLPGRVFCDMIAMLNGIFRLFSA